MRPFQRGRPAILLRATCPLPPSLPPSAQPRLASADTGHGVFEKEKHETKKSRPPTRRRRRHFDFVCQKSRSKDLLPQQSDAADLPLRSCFSFSEDAVPVSADAKRGWAGGGGGREGGGRCSQKNRGSFLAGMAASCSKDGKQVKEEEKQASLAKGAGAEFSPNARIIAGGDAASHFDGFGEPAAHRPQDKGGDLALRSQ